MAERSILHIDMDAFFASVHQRDDPSLRGKPVLVGGRSKRSVVTAASYESRPFGCRSAMPMGEALRLCPHAIVVEPARGKYEEASREVFDVFRHYTPLVEGLSIDEAFLDVTASQSLFGDGETIARKIKDEVKSVTRLVASAGVAPCKFVAKVASDFRKPDGLVVVREEDVRQFLAPMPIERMWGVGPKTAPHLRALGYATLGDLANGRREDLERHLGVWGEQVRLLARGEDPREVEPHVGAKTIGSGRDVRERSHDARRNLARTARSIRARRAATPRGGLQRGNRRRENEIRGLHFEDAPSRAPRFGLRHRLDPSRRADHVDRFGLEDGLFRVRLTGIAAAGLVEGPPPKASCSTTKRSAVTTRKVAAAIAGKFPESSNGAAAPARDAARKARESHTKPRHRVPEKSSFKSLKTISKERGR